MTGHEPPATEELRDALSILGRLLSEDPRVRALAADEVTDVLHSLGALGPVVAGVLAAARLAEGDRAAQEAQLHALAELHEWDLVPKETRELISGLDRSAVWPEQWEYLDVLLDRGE